VYFPKSILDFDITLKSMELVAQWLEYVKSRVQILAQVIGLNEYGYRLSRAGSRVQIPPNSTLYNDE
jgi:hypothetical protein